MIIGFFTLWIVLCGNVTGEILLVGAVVTAAVFWFTCRFCHWSISKEKLFLKLVWPGIKYILLLISEIAKASWAVLKLLAKPRMVNEIEPHLMEFQVPLKTNIARMTLANSITLTPGTITVENRGKEFVLHCIHPSFAEDVDCSVFVVALQAMEAIVFAHEKEGKKC